MKQLKEEFTFQYQNKTIQVRLCGEVYCAVFDVKGKEVARPLIIEIYDDKTHNGKIMTREGSKFLSWLPSEAIEIDLILMEQKYVQENIDIDKIMSFEEDHLISVTFEDDCQHHCYIDKNVYSSGFTFMYTLLTGIANYKNQIK